MYKKIVIIGPESTGKSTLCRQLAKHFNTVWVPEYAREYLEKNGTNYTYEDLLWIAEGQLQKEDTVASTISQSQSVANHLFIDTDMYVMKVWCEFVFGKCHTYILDQIVLRKYDLYLLCNIDLPWVKDDLREYPDLETREKLYHIYQDIMINQGVPWVDVRGNYEERLQLAIDAIKAI